MEEKPTVLVLIEGGQFIETFFTGDVRVLLVDNACKRDRVYQMSFPSDPETITQIIGDSEIGHRGDGMISVNEIAAIKAAFAKKRNSGKTSLKPIDEHFAGLPEHLQPKGGKEQ